MLDTVNDPVICKLLVVAKYDPVSWNILPPPALGKFVKPDPFPIKLPENKDALFTKEN